LALRDRGGDASRHLAHLGHKCPERVAVSAWDFGMHDLLQVFWLLVFRLLVFRSPGLLVFWSSLGLVW